VNVNSAKTHLLELIHLAQQLINVNFRIPGPEGRAAIFTPRARKPLGINLRSLARGIKRARVWWHVADF
jgi:hypothetical protein